MLEAAPMWSSASGRKRKKRHGWKKNRRKGRSRNPDGDRDRVPDRGASPLCLLLLRARVLNRRRLKLLLQRHPPLCPRRQVLQPPPRLKLHPQTQNRPWGKIYSRPASASSPAKEPVSEPLDLFFLFTQGMMGCFEGDRCEVYLISGFKLPHLR